MSLYGKTDSNENLDKVIYASALGNVLPQADIIFVDNTEAALAENKNRGLNAPGWWRYFSYTDGEGNTRHKAELLVTIADPEANASETQSDDEVAADATSIIEISLQPLDQETYVPLGAVRAISLSGGTTLVGEANQSYIVEFTNGFEVEVTRDGDGEVVNVVITQPGEGYEEDDEVVVLGSSIGGDDVTDDLTLTVIEIATAAATFTVTAADSPDLGDIVYQWQVQTATGTRWSNISGETSASLALTGLTTADSGKKYRVKLTSTAGATEVISNVATLTVTAA